MSIDLHDAKAGDQLFCAGQTSTFGSVRCVLPAEGMLDVWIENLGDVALEKAWIVAIHDGKVEVDYDALPENLQDAIQRAHAQEDAG